MPLDRNMPVRRKVFLPITFLVLPLVSTMQLASAETLVGTSKTVTAADPLDNFRLVNGAQLNVLGGSTRQIDATRSTVNVQGGTVSATGTSVQGINLVNSVATLTNATVTSAGGGALLVARNAATSTGSRASVTDSTLRGASYGAMATGFSTLSLVGTQVQGTAAGSSGLNVRGATVTATNSTLSGDAVGVQLRRDRTAPGEAAILNLDGSRVSARSGAAIQVLDAVTATINVDNGSTLSGVDGALLNVQANSTATMNVRSSELSGNVQIEAGSSGHLLFNQASMVGDVIALPGGNATLALGSNSQLSGKLDNVQKVNIDAGSSWTMTGDSTVGALALEGGKVTFGDTSAFHQLNVTNLSGNGAFVMGANFVTGQSDFLNVTGTSSGNHGLLVASSGTEASVESLQLVQTADGGAQFHLLNDRERVDVGAYSYALGSRDNGWYLDHETRTVSPATRAVMALFNTPITVHYGEMASLRSRMGELRYSEGKRAGLWMRAYGNQHNIADASSGVGYQQNQRGLSLGADMRVGESDWLVGVLAGSSRSDLNLSYGTKGEIDSYYVGGYATWLDRETGWYVDSVLKYNRYQNEAKVGLSDGTRAKGDYDTEGLSASVEVGKHIKLDQGYFIEPFAKLDVAAVDGKNFSLDNDLRAEGDVSRSLLAKVGTTVGKTIELGPESMVQPYVKAAFANEFAQRNQVQVNNNVFNNDLSGGRAELGAGVALALSKSFQVHADFDYMNGKNIEKPYGVNLGLRYAF